MKRIAAITLVAAGLLVGCGDDTTTTVIQTTPAETTTTDETTGDELSPDDQQVLEMLLSASPEDLAKVCKSLSQGYSREQAYQQGINNLSKLILEQGGQPSVVVNALLDEC